MNTNLTTRIYVHFCKPQICWNIPCLYVANLCFFRLNLCCDSGVIMVGSWLGLGKDHLWLKIPALVSLNLPEMSWLLIKNISFCCNKHGWKLSSALLKANQRCHAYKSQNTVDPHQTYLLKSHLLEMRSLAWQTSQLSKLCHCLLCLLIWTSGHKWVTWTRYEMYRKKCQYGT